MHKNFSSLRLVISYMTIKIINTCNKKISLLCTTIVHGHDYLWDKVLSVWKRRHTCLLSSIVKIVKIHFVSSSTVQASLLAYIELKITKQKIIYLLPRSIESLVSFTRYDGIFHETNSLQQDERYHRYRLFA